MYHHHFDHLDRFADGLKVGDTVRKGQLAGYCGKTGTTSPHCHYEIMVKKPTNWLQYTYGMTLEAARALYVDPDPYVTKVIPMKWDHLGYDFMDKVVQTKNGVTRVGWHAGVDLNWGSGADDLGLPVYFTCDGVIEYLGNKETDGGAGNNLWWVEKTIDPENMPSKYEGKIIQMTEKDIPGSGEFAFVQDGKKRIIRDESRGWRALATLEVIRGGTGMNKVDWDAIVTGKDF